MMEAVQGERGFGDPDFGKSIGCMDQVGVDFVLKRMRL
jgi:hypothetical protein